MEFANQGSHCQVLECSQQDFLPFRCDYCNLELCLIHRAYSAHGCAGALAKDRTSIDCPICQKSVVFTKDQNADEVWDKHYRLECSHEAGAAHKPLPICGNSSCNIRMKLSNRYECKKCGVTVCLSCRVPEVHGCASVAREQRAKAAESRMKNGRKVSHNSKKSSNNKKSEDAEQQHACPFCSITFSSADQVLKHVNQVHQEDPGVWASPARTPISVPIDLTRSAGTGSVTAHGGHRGVDRECPLCGRRFSDVGALTRHASTCDGTGGPGPRSSVSESSSNRNGGQCKIV